MHPVDRSSWHWYLLVAALACGRPALGQSSPAGQDPAPPPRFEERVEVVTATPLHGLGIDREKVPSNVQVLTSETLDRTGAVTMAERLALGAQSAHINEATTNPFQPDIQFRGFVGSPLLGLPQGVAVYQNGVRLNEPFGDTVNWDLIPNNAVAAINLMPGSNPLFGLNALGGAVSVQTKTGFSHPGHAIEYSGGSFGRHAVSAATGGHGEQLSYFVAGTALSESGWRTESPSRLRQLFGDLEWRRPSSTLNVTLSSAANRLIGNGPAPIQLLDEDRSAVFTFPDETKTRMTLLSVRGRHMAATTVALDGMAFYRRASVRTLNGDDSGYGECDDDAFAGLLCSDEGEGEPVEDQLARVIPVADEGEFDATNNTSSTATHGWGGAFQATVTKALAGRPNHFVAGMTFDGGRSRYEADTEIARLTDARGTVGTGLFDDEAVVRLRTRVAHAGVYAADFWTIAPKLTVMGAARFNRSAIRLRDQAGDDLDGDHTFSRVNPAVGATLAVAPRLTAFGSVSLSSRAPAPSELSCADPEDPCRLPNAFVSDPPLEQVVARTSEVGIRGRRASVNWNASVFRTISRDDIIFISSGPLTNTGHFENVGDTRRTGFEFGVSGAPARLNWMAAYTFVQAEFGTPLTLSSPNHPGEADGEIAVASGARLPGVPQHNVKLGLSGTVKRLSLGGNLWATSSQYLRGDEANLLPAVDGFALANLSASYAVSPQVRVTARATNVFGIEYSTFGVLGEADEVLGDAYDDPRFVSPGAPRGAWVGLTVAFR